MQRENDAPFLRLLIHLANLILPFALALLWERFGRPGGVRQSPLLGGRTA